MNMFIRTCFFMLMGSILIAGCNNNNKVPFNHDAIVKAPALTAPFKFHKLIESSPGQYYDVLSWGRGATDTGSFVILHSDSSGKKYTTTTGDLNGTVTDVYNTDMDVDGNPEILIQARKKDTINYTTIYAFEFSDNKANKLDFPKLTQSQRKGYRGNDNFYIEEGKFIREFPIYEGSGAAAKPSGAKRKLEYSLISNSISVKQLSKDSITAGSAPVVATVTPAKAETKQTSSQKSKKHVEPVKHKKPVKKHKRHSDDN